MTIITLGSVFLVLIVAVVVSANRKRQADPFYRLPNNHRTHPNTEYLNELIEVDQSGTPVAVLDEHDARQALYEIVNNPHITVSEKDAWLDRLYFKVQNEHPEGVRAHICDDIMDESNHLRHPDWHGTRGTFQSVQRRR